jgi:hypothetical protein
MVGRGVPGLQFWAVRRGGPGSVLVVLDLHGHLFARAVLDVAGSTDTARSPTAARRAVRFKAWRMPEGRGRP